ncbi:MAG TPA: beta-ketoacyl synthase chain length factor [Rhodanobacteraceae bacterium]|nr:beta-ketoacyl synthase chain length factor [Rhodanobacteraceae bacterium]
MSTTLRLAVRGIGAWTTGAPDWPALRGVLLGTTALAAAADAKPSAAVLPAAERRRAPASVRLAAEVAAQACAAAGVDPASLPAVFASTHGALAITDYVCTTLARAPLELSPTQFHNSVLNAPAGYWTIATGCTATSSALTAYHCTFAAGLLEAATLAVADSTPVLYATCDVAATGPLAAMAQTTRAFGAALVLDPVEAGTARLRLAPVVRADAPPALSATLDALAAHNPTTAHTLAVLQALAGRGAQTLTLPLSRGLSLHMEITP